MLLGSPGYQVSGGISAFGACFLLMLLASTRGVVAQEVIVIPEEPAPPCVIAFVPDGPELTGGAEAVTEDIWPSTGEIELLPEGRIAIVEGFIQGQGVVPRFFVASRDGSGGQWVGRSGEGPGEYSFVRSVKPFGDHLHVFDQYHSRRTVLDAKTFDVVDTNRMEAISHLGDPVVLSDSMYVMNGYMYNGNPVRDLLHMFDGAGEVVRSFDKTYIVDPGKEPIMDPWRVLAPARDGGVWSGWVSQYQVDLWDAASGNRRLSLNRDAPWFLPHDGEQLPNQPGNPRMQGITEDAEGRLWVQISVPPEGWSECWVKAPPSEHPEAPEYEVIPGCLSWGTRLEVLDPGAGRVIAAQILPPDLRGLRRLTPGGMAFSMVTDEHGLAKVKQWRVVLRPATNSRGGSQC